MSVTPPPVVPRKPTGVRVMMPLTEQLSAGGLPVYTGLSRRMLVNGASDEPKHTIPLNEEREVEILNHCFDDVERFMGRLQQIAEARSILNQKMKKKKEGRRSQKKKDQDVEKDLLTMKARPPSEEEFVDIFQKVKYSLSLLDRLKSSITEPDSPELVHHVFLPLDLMVKTTGGPELAAAVSSPALTSGAVSLLQEHLTEEERELWTSLGPNWTLHRSQLGKSVPPYSPVFLDGWQPQALNSDGQPLDDPIESQHKQDASRSSREDTARQKTERPISTLQPTDEIDSTELPPEGERHFCCSYDFVARNSSELSVLQGETLEVVESSKRWWRCRNRFDQIGFVPFNILEPLSALNNAERNSPAPRTGPKKVPLSPLSLTYFSYAPPSPSGTSSPSTSPMSMTLPATTHQGEEGDRVVMIVKDELLQRLANGRSGSIRPLVIPRTADTSVPLDYHSPPAEVEAWLNSKGFSQQTVQSLGILSGAQLFSLNKEELRSVSSEEGSRVYSQIMVQRALLEDVHETTELEAVMEKQKLKVDLKSKTETL